MVRFVCGVEAAPMTAAGAWDQWVFGLMPRAMPTGAHMPCLPSSNAGTNIEDRVQASSAQHGDTLCACWLHCRLPCCGGTVDFHPAKQEGVVAGLPAAGRGIASGTTPVVQSPVALAIFFFFFVLAAGLICHDPPAYRIAAHLYSSAVAV